MSSFSLGDLLDFKKFELKDIGRKLKKDPKRLLVGGITPWDTKLTNKITGEDYEPLVDQWGGTYGGHTTSAFGQNEGGAYGRARDAGINTSSAEATEDLAHVISAMYAGNYGASKIPGYGKFSQYSRYIPKGGGRGQSAQAQVEDEQDDSIRRRTEELIRRYTPRQALPLADGGSVGMSYIPVDPSAALRGYQAGSSWAEQNQRNREERRRRNRDAAISQALFRTEGGSELYPEIDEMFNPYVGRLKQWIQNWKAQRQERQAARRAGADTPSQTPSALPVGSGGAPQARASAPGTVTGTRTWAYGDPNAPQQEPLQFGPITRNYQDGGTVRDAQEALRRVNIADFERAQRPGVVSRLAGAGRRALNFGGRYTGPLAAILPAVDVATEDDINQAMEDRFGYGSPNVPTSGGEGFSIGPVRITSGDEGEASLVGAAQHLGKVGLHYASEAGAAIPLLGPRVRRLFRDTPQGQTTSRPDVAAAIQVPAEESASPASPPTGGGGAATPQSEPSPFVGDPTADQEAAELGSIDVMPDDMPTMGTRDWVEYRAQAVPLLVAKGMTPQEAHQSVTTMQHQGFMSYGQQAAAMLQAGNQQGAARALKAAYQHFPNGKDVRFGFQNGTLVGIALDEETGEVTGTPQVITPEYLAATLTNFENPERFLTWTKDWRDDAFRERQYQEVTRPTAQARIEQGNRALEIDEANTMARMIEATGGGSGGMSEADIARSEEVYRDTFVNDFDLEPEVARELSSIASQVRIAIPPAQLPDNQIIEDIYRAYASGDLEGVKAALGIQ